MATKTYPQLGAAVDVEATDLLASFRGLGPLKKVQASALKTYINTDVPGTSTTFQQADSDTIRTGQDKARDLKNVKDWGVVADGVTDDTEKLMEALDYCRDNGFAIEGTPGNCLVTATITIKCSGDLSAMTIVADATAVDPVVRVGNNTGTGAQAELRLDLILPKITNSAKVGAGWAGFEDAVGLDIANLYESRVTIPFINGFGVGAKIGGYTAGNSYNEYRLGMSQNNKIHFQLGAQGITGHSNENNYYGGWTHYTSNEGTEIAGAYMFYLVKFPGGNAGPNNNVFYKPSVEGDGPEFHFFFSDSSSNLVVSPRFESAAPCRVCYNSTTTNETSDNVFIAGYKTGTLDFTYTGQPSRFNKYIGSRSYDSLDYTGGGLNIVNQSTSGVTAPHIQGFQAGVNAIAQTEAATNWVYRTHGNGITIKATGQTHANIDLSASNGRLFLGDGTGAATGYLVGGNGAFIYAAAAFQPLTDNAFPCGGTSNRFTEFCAVNPAINTSDAREKQQIRPLSEAERAVGLELRSLIRAYKWNEAVKAKGDGARIHVGVIAQEVIKAFEAQGLDPFAYGAVCFDEWEATDAVVNGDDVVIPAKEAGSRYGVRYEELFAFVLGAL